MRNLVLLVAFSSVAACALEPSTASVGQKVCTVDDPSCGDTGGGGPIEVYPDDQEAQPAIEALESIGRDNAPTEAVCKLRRYQYHTRIACCVTTGQRFGYDVGQCCSATVNTEDGYVSQAGCEEDTLVGAYLTAI